MSETKETVTEDNFGKPYVRHFTHVVEKQTWDTGAEYRITHTYVSNNPESRGQLLKTSSAPW